MLSANPGSHVVTVFSSGPSSVVPLPSWDKASRSFKPGDDVMAARAVEDDEAMALVRAHPHRLGFWDEQYRAGSPTRLGLLRSRAMRSGRWHPRDPSLLAVVEEALRSVISALDVLTWVVPLGLWHGDHKLVAYACLRLASQMPESRWVVYEELPYRIEQPAEVRAAHRRLIAHGFAVEPATFQLDPDLSRKRALVSCYRSQLRPLGRRVETAITASEIFYHLVRTHQSPT